MRENGTVLLVEVEYVVWDDSGNRQVYIVGGDLLMLTGMSWSHSIETVCVATGQRIWMERDWLVKHTSIAFDARNLAD